MKKIFGFDSAIQNLGVCYVLYNDNWKQDILNAIEELRSIYDDIDNLTKENLNKALIKNLTRINDILENIITFQCMDVINLIYDANANNTNNKIPTMIERTARIKKLLTYLDMCLEPPDIVLIEYQMKSNDISRALSHQIAYHYTNTMSNIQIGQHIKLHIGGLNTNEVTSRPESVNTTLVDMVGTTLKNTYCIAPDGRYGNFIVKYSNYIANKKHTDHNFKYFLKAFNKKESGCISKLTNKSNDIADAFLMIYGWLKKNNML